MDKQTSEQNTEQKDKAAPLIEGMNTPAKESRFSRRRFLQTGVAASPLLMTVKSPVAWACNTQTNGTANAHTSGNTSTAAGGTITKLKKLTPKEWDDVFCGCYSRESLQAKLEWYLSLYNISDRTEFFNLLKGLYAHSHSNNTWARCGSNRVWKYQVYVSRDCNPAVNQVLNGGVSAVQLRFRRLKGSGYGYRYKTVTMSASSLHKDVTCAYLNSMAADAHFVDWASTRAMVMSDVNLAFNSAARACIEGNGKFTITQVNRAKLKLASRLAHFRV